MIRLRSSLSEQFMLAQGSCVVVLFINGIAVRHATSPPLSGTPLCCFLRIDLSRRYPTSRRSKLFKRILWNWQVWRAGFHMLQLAVKFNALGCHALGILLCLPPVSHLRGRDAVPCETNLVK